MLYFDAEISTPVVAPFPLALNSAAPVTLSVPLVAMVMLATVTKLSIEPVVAAAGVQAGRVGLL